MMAQWAPGKPNKWSRYYPDTYDDSYSSRHVWFKQCLDALDDVVKDDVVAMPFFIGCGLAGGNWLKYREILEKCKTMVRLYDIS